MRKRSRYRPRAVYVNPVAYVIEGLMPVSQHGQYLIDLKIKNHGAMATLTKGQATKTEIDLLISCANITEALYRMGFGGEYGDVVNEGHEALLAVGRRGLQTGKFILKAQEMLALNNLMELHDAQMDVITIKDMEKAVLIVRRELEQKKAKTIVEKS